MSRQKVNSGKKAVSSNPGGRNSRRQAGAHSYTSSSHSLKRLSSHQGYHISSKDEGDGTVGLVNIGNTCFMNSMIHCLSNTVPLREYVLSSRCKNELNSSSKMKGKLMTCFTDLLKQLWAADSKSAVTPRVFKSQIQKFSPRFGGYEQQDSQEFLRFLLEGLHEDINKVKVRSKKGVPEFHNLTAQEQAAKTWAWYKSKDDSYIFDLFVGQLESALKCSECRNVSLTFDPFWDLSLPIAKSFYSSEQTQLEECLSNFTKEETLDGDEKPYCEKCKARRKMTKKLSIHKFPKILVLHLKRFNEGGRFRQKLSNLVSFPMKNLSLSSYASQDAEEQGGPIYDLYAVSNHSGSCYGGHYTAYCLNNDSKVWHTFNDSNVSTTRESSICSKEAYVLFYQRRKQNARL